MRFVLRKMFVFLNEIGFHQIWRMTRLGTVGNFLLWIFLQLFVGINGFFK
jgi:hypothetical protein